MGYWSETNLNWYLEELVKNDTPDVALTLFVVGQIEKRSQRQPIPTGNAKVIAYLEWLVDDRRGCRIEWRVPFQDSDITYGEIRWLAARVLVCEYAYLGIEKPIILKDVVQPTRGGYIAEIEKKHQRHGLDTLIHYGLLPTATEIHKPQDYADCCSKEAVERRLRGQEKDKK